MEEAGTRHVGIDLGKRAYETAIAEERNDGGEQREDLCRRAASAAQEAAPPGQSGPQGWEHGEGDRGCGLQDVCPEPAAACGDLQVDEKDGQGGRAEAGAHSRGLPGGAPSDGGRPERQGDAFAFNNSRPACSQ